MDIQNYFIFGCGIYIQKGFKAQHTFWIEDKVSGNSEVLYVNWEQYHNHTSIDIYPEKSTILHCKSCENTNCKYHTSYNENQNATVDIDKLFQPDPFIEKRDTLRLNLMLKIKLFNLRDLSDSEEIDRNNFHYAKVNNLSCTGCNVILEKMPEEEMPDILDNVEIMFASNVIIRKKSSDKTDQAFNLKALAPIVGEVVWRVGYNCGVQFISVRREDRLTIDDMINRLYNI